MSYQADDYRPKQAARDAEYRREYEAWVQSLPPKERAKLKAAGLEEPLCPSRSGGAPSESDFADSPLASETPDMLETIEPCDQPAYQGARMDDDAMWDVLRRLLGELLSQKNAKLSLECLALVSGVSFLGDSMTEIGKRHGVTRAAVSKRCVELTEKLGLLPSRAMRSLTARDAYARARHNRLQSHERPHHA